MSRAAGSPSTRRQSVSPSSPERTGSGARIFRDAAYHLVTSTPEAVEAIGGDELLYEDGVARGGGYMALRTGETSQLAFAVVGSMTDAAEARGLADRYAAGIADTALLEPATRYWRHVTRDLRVGGEGKALTAEQAILPWLAHDAMVHLTVPHGLEQYTGAAWGTRDVCQGPLEFMLALRHDETARKILTTLFAEQYRTRGDWPQWFMLPPYSNIRAGEAHGDIVVWPLKALCDYVEATGDFAVLDVHLPWRRDDTLKPTEETGTIREHVELLLATVASALHPRHASHPLWRGRLERLPSACRSASSRLDGVDLDGRAALRADPALCRDPRAHGRIRGGERTGVAGRRDAQADVNRP
jgi:hypothetical protein